MTRDMRTITIGKRSKGLLHIEAPGCIVNIKAHLTDREGRAVTSVEIMADGDRYTGGPEWWLPDFPDRPAGFNARVVQCEKPEAPSKEVARLLQCERVLRRIVAHFRADIEGQQEINGGDAVDFICEAMPDMCEAIGEPLK